MATKEETVLQGGLVSDEEFAKLKSGEEGVITPAKKSQRGQMLTEAEIDTVLAAEEAETEKTKDDVSADSKKQPEDKKEENGDEDEDDDSDDDSLSPEEQEKLDRALKKRLKREKKRSSREIEYWKSEAQRGQSAAQTIASEPQWEQFNGDYKAYAKAHSDWQVQQYVQQKEQQAAKERNEQILIKFKEREAKYSRENPDYYSSLQNAQNIQVPNDVLTAIAESKVGPAINHYLSKNLDILFELKDMSPTRRLFEVGKIAAGLDAKKEAPSRTIKATSKPAPEPVTPTKGTAPTTQKPLHKMTQIELLNYLNAEELAKRKKAMGIK